MLRLVWIVVQLKVLAAPQDAACCVSTKTLPLRELEALSCSLLSVLLALFAPCVARKQTFALELFAQLDVELEQRAGDAQFDCIRLPVNAAAIYRGNHVERGAGLAANQRRLCAHALGFGHKIVVERTPVHLKTPAAGTQKHASDARLATSRAVVLNQISHRNSVVSYFLKISTQQSAISIQPVNRWWRIPNFIQPKHPHG